MWIRRAIVRAVNKMRGVSAEDLRKMRYLADASISSVAMYMHVEFMMYYDWETEFRPIPPKDYARAVEYLNYRWMEAQGIAGKNTRSKREESGVEFVG